MRLPAISLLLVLVVLGVALPAGSACAREPATPAGRNQTPIVVTTTGQEVAAGQSGSLIIPATMKVGNPMISGIVPVVSFEVVPPSVR